MARYRSENDWAGALKSDPVLFSRTVLNFPPVGYQQRIMEAVRDHEQVAVASCNAIGKTAITSAIVLWFLCTHIPSIIYTTAPTDRQVRRVLWKEIAIRYNSANRHLRASGWKMPGTLYKVPNLEISPEHHAYGFSTDKPDNAMGIHGENLLAVLEEASGISEDVWAATYGNLGGAGIARLLAIGNPLERSTHFYRAFNSDSFHSIHVSAYDTPNFLHYGITEDDIITGRWKSKITGKFPYPSLVQPRFASQIFEMYGGDSLEYQARVLGVFPSHSDNTLIPYSAIQAAMERWKHWEEAPEEAPIRPGEGPRELGADIADGGRDSTVLTLRDGGFIHPQTVLAGAKTTETEGIMKIMAYEHNVESVKIDKVGLGHHLWRTLQDELDMPVHGINNGAAPFDKEQFSNQLAEAMWGLRQMIVGGRLAIPPHDVKLIDELVNVRYTRTGSNKLVILKDEMKALLKRSPDRMESLAYSTYTPHHVDSSFIADAQGMHEARGEDEDDDPDFYSIRGRTIHNLFSGKIGRQLL